MMAIFIKFVCSFIISEDSGTLVHLYLLQIKEMCMEKPTFNLKG